MIDGINLIEKMLAAVRRYSMICSGERVLAAVSGGPDSVALLHSLFSVRERMGISLLVAHLNHSFRGLESDADADFVRSLADDLGLECIVEKIDVPKIRAVLRLSEEEAARMVRYEFLERTAEDVKANRIAVGHTADDQAETVLLNLLRGTGVDGLSGMPPVRGKLIRPLIDIRRLEVLQYIEEKGLKSRIDATNYISTYSRNRVRSELIPVLERDYNPEVVPALLRLAELACDDTTYIRERTIEALKRSTLSREDGCLVLNPNKILEYPVSIKRRLLREAVRTVNGGLKDIGFIHIEEVLRLLKNGSDFKYELPGGAHVSRSRSTVNISASKPDEILIEYCREVPIPGEIKVSEIQATVRAKVSAAPLDPVRRTGSLEVVLDKSAVVGSVFIRNWRQGDRIRPLGMRGSKKVQDVFVDEKIPLEAKRLIPLIVDERNVLWIAGMTVSDEAKITPKTCETIILDVSYD